jgi:hypothetical protein
MTFTEEDIAELFATKAFKQALGSYLRENLTVEVVVDHGSDYFSQSDSVRVEVGLVLADEEVRFSRNSPFTYSSDSVTVSTGNGSSY